MADGRKKWVTLSATGLFAGYMPVASGTFGTVVAVPLCYLLTRLGPLPGALLIAGFAGLAVWVSDEAERLFQEKDSSRIVIDEMAGFLVTMYYVPWNVTTLVAGFLLFRFMDIVKPFPIARLQDMRGGWGVVADDLLAGIYANLIVRIAVRFIF